MQLQVRDWVRTSENEIGKIESIDVKAKTAKIQALDDTGQRIVVLTFPLDRLVKHEVKQIIATQ